MASNVELSQDFSKKKAEGDKKATGESAEKVFLGLLYFGFILLAGGASFYRQLCYVEVGLKLIYRAIR